jgi:hypothetical protein
MITDAATIGFPEPADKYRMREMLAEISRRFGRAEYVIADHESVGFIPERRGLGVVRETRRMELKGHIQPNAEYAEKGAKPLAFFGYSDPEGDPLLFRGMVFEHERDGIEGFTNGEIELMGGVRELYGTPRAQE